MSKDEGAVKPMKQITADQIVAAIERGVRWDKKEVGQIAMQVILTTDGMNFTDHGKPLKKALLNADSEGIRKVFADALLTARDAQ